MSVYVHVSCFGTKVTITYNITQRLISSVRLWFDFQLTYWIPVVNVLLSSKNLSEWPRFKSGWQIRDAKWMIVANSGRSETPRPGYKIRRDPISYQDTYKRNGHIICKCLIVYASLCRHYISAYNFFRSTDMLLCLCIRLSVEDSISI